MAEKALHYDVTCHHFRVTEMTRGHALLPKQQSACPRAEPWLSRSQRAPALTRASFDSTCAVFLTNSRHNQAGWEENQLLISRASTFDLEKSKGRCQLPRMSFAWRCCDGTWQAR